eukprot:2711478-Pyramimonas_sp.AAC.1
MTHDNAAARSRLDRVYWNQSVSEQLDRHIFCAPLEWVPHLSAHKAVAFGRRCPARTSDGPRPVPAAILRDPRIL